ncbi:MAG: endonuclease/exonuclease/phosphatase family protein [Deltaproteobacteria bacterium]|nr:endonuclease/exonuclease/phosphatase family protein [Deltaproteobacteria bacterium]MCW5802960.1 endonuclease/exonuclease/phosphatase family protein [Deltaproteobacteria bacterium]
MKKTIAVLLVAIALHALRSRTDGPRPPLRFATFNIENYPKNDRQVDAAFREIAALGASFVAVQEIVDPELFARTAQVELGLTWELVHASTAPRGEERRLMVQHLGVLFDRAAWTLASTAVHDGTRLEQGRYKPVLEVRLAPRGGGDVVRVLVVHLKAGGDDRAIRARQYAALAAIVRAARSSGERVVVLGDFNATDDAGDRDDLAALAARTDLRWLTESLACSAFWDRADGCFRSRLDHILASEPAREVTATGACATSGCAMEPSCPRYIDDVSDHCPVVAEL